MLLTTHYMDEVEYLCDRIGLMDGAKLIRLGTLTQLRQEHDQGLVVKQICVRWKYNFFFTRKERIFMWMAKMIKMEGWLFLLIERRFL